MWITVGHQTDFYSLGHERANGRYVEEEETDMNTQIDLLLPLEDHELDNVSGGFIKGALEGVCRNDEASGGASGGQNDPTQMFQQIIQQLTQGHG